MRVPDLPYYCTLDRQQQSQRVPPDVMNRDRGQVRVQWEVLMLRVIAHARARQPGMHDGSYIFRGASQRPHTGLLESVRNPLHPGP